VASIALLIPYRAYPGPKASSRQWFPKVLTGALKSQARCMSLVMV
jgi:hypothetical protein